MAGSNGRARRFWTPKEAAEYLGVNTQTIYAYIRGPKQYETRPARLKGPKPPHRRFGRNCIRFPITEFKQWADGPYQQQGS